MRRLFLPVAKSMGIEIYAPDEGFVSFFNSPYYSHLNALAVDIYPNSDEAVPDAPSPVEGVISNIYEFKSPDQKYFRTPETEKLVLISTPKRPDLRVRILHVDCALKIGASVAVGEPLGPMERSGFFNFWTARHIHVEVRRLEEPLRAKGAFPMEPINFGEGVEGSPKEEMTAFEARAVGSDYLLADAGSSVVRLGRFWGLGCVIGGQLGILDCGLPHYGYGGVHLVGSSSIKNGDSVRLWDVDIGLVTRVFKNFALFKFRPLSVFVDNAPFRGLSLYLWLRENRKIKILPDEPTPFPAVQKFSSMRLVAV